MREEDFTSAHRETRPMQRVRLCVLCALAPARVSWTVGDLWSSFPGIPESTLRGAIRELEGEGLVQVDRTQNPQRVRIVVHPQLPGPEGPVTRIRPELPAHREGL